MINAINNFIDTHTLAVTIALVFSIGLNLKFKGESVPQTIFRVVTGFRFGFLKSSLATFMCVMFILLYAWKGVVAAAAVLIVLRWLWLIEYSFWAMDNVS